MTAHGPDLAPLVWGLRLVLVLVLVAVPRPRLVHLEGYRAARARRGPSGHASSDWWLPWLPQADGTWGPLTDNHWWAAFRRERGGSGALAARWGFWGGSPSSSRSGPWPPSSQRWPASSPSGSDRPRASPSAGCGGRACVGGAVGSSPRLGLDDGAVMSSRSSARSGGLDGVLAERLAAGGDTFEATSRRASSSARTTSSATAPPPSAHAPVGMDRSTRVPLASATTMTPRHDPRPAGTRRSVASPWPGGHVRRAGRGRPGPGARGRSGRVRHQVPPGWCRGPPGRPRAWRAVRPARRRPPGAVGEWAPMTWAVISSERRRPRSCGRGLRVEIARARAGRRGARRRPGRGGTAADR